MSRRAQLVIAVAVAMIVAGAAWATGTGDDPARVAGDWDYRTRSNCGSVVGVGSVRFTWSSESRTYDERGHVYWSDSGNTISWWGTNVFDAQTRQLTGVMHNTLGDRVDGRWQLEGQGPDRLVVRWNQTNGCVGEGIATRRVRAP